VRQLLAVSFQLSAEPREKILTAEVAEQIAKDAEKVDYTNYEFAETGFCKSYIGVDFLCGLS